jgi:hypothetical protein
MYIYVLVPSPEVTRFSLDKQKSKTHYTLAKAISPDYFTFCCCLFFLQVSVAVKNHSHYVPSNTNIFYTHSAFNSGLFAQADLVGVWKGSSICQIKNSPCHDEQVVYHISKNNRDSSFNMIMNKIVDNKEENMGTLKFLFDPQQGTLISIDTTRKARWEFKIKDKSMNGTLIYQGELYRIIEVKKEN